VTRAAARLRRDQIGGRGDDFERGALGHWKTPWTRIDQ
jgi:hypothetical protein